MCDYFDNFEDTYDDFQDDDSFEDSLEGEMDEPVTGDSEHGGKTGDAESEDDDFTAKDAFIIGGTMGCAYHEGRRERKRRRRGRFRDDSE